MKLNETVFYHFVNNHDNCSFTLCSSHSNYINFAAVTVDETKKGI